MINPLDILSPSYLFDPRPGSEFFYFWPLVILTVAVFVGSFKVKQKNIAARMREFSALALLFTFFRDQNIPYLGMRFWIVLIFLAALAYALVTWKKSKKKTAAAPQAHHKADTFTKYLPKKKRR